MKVLTMQLNSIIIMDFIAYGGAALGIVLACAAFAGGRLGLSGCVFMLCCRRNSSFLCAVWGVISTLL